MDRPPFHEAPYDGPIYEGPLPPPNRPPYPEEPVYEGPRPPFKTPPNVYREKPAPGSHRLPHYFTQEDFASPSYFDDNPASFGGAFSGDSGPFSRVFMNSSNPIKFNSIIDEYQKRYENQGHFVTPGFSFGSDGSSLPNRQGKGFSFPPDGRRDKNNLIAFDRVAKVR